MMKGLSTLGVSQSAFRVSNCLLIRPSVFGPRTLVQQPACIVKSPVRTTFLGSNSGKAPVTLESEPRLSGPVRRLARIIERFIVCWAAQL